MESMKKFPEIKSKFSKVSEYILFLHTSKEKSDTIFKYSIPFVIITTEAEYLGTYLMKDEQNLFTESYKT